MHGEFTFANQRYRHKQTGQLISFLDSCRYQSKGLREFYSYYAGRLSYRETELLVGRFSGAASYGARHLCNKVSHESKAVGQYQLQASAGQQLSFNFADPVDIYAAGAGEITYMDDGVGVKRQKPSRGKPLQAARSGRVQTDVVVVGDDSAGYRYLSSALARATGIALEELIGLSLSQRYSNARLPVVAITDGATSIGKRVGRLFGEDVPVILDWYHLSKKVRDYLSRLSLKKQDKEEHIRQMQAYLWRGQAREALIYSDEMVKTRQGAILEELQGYLLKHEGEICDYQRRQQAGKAIGSGRGEKANDQMVALRQKKKGMAWSQQGSGALTILRSLELNQQWENYWKLAA